MKFAEITSMRAGILGMNLLRWFGRAILLSAAFPGMIPYTCAASGRRGGINYFFCS
jgi:hypothetical protein